RSVTHKITMEVNGDTCEMTGEEDEGANEVE
ncbi:MAG: hypothetical protein JWN78_2652, partial [Bacteroidota bacterium]|nr:hypothetical protein [Bacteroidota bacterium]